MAGTLTKSDIKFDEVQIIRETIIDPDTFVEKLKWFVVERYIVLTEEGEQYAKHRRKELVGAKKTSVKNFFANELAAIKSEEGITS